MLKRQKQSRLLSVRLTLIVFRAICTSSSSTYQFGQNNCTGCRKDTDADTERHIPSRLHEWRNLAHFGIEVSLFGVFFGCAFWWIARLCLVKKFAVMQPFWPKLELREEEPAHMIGAHRRVNIVPAWDEHVAMLLKRQAQRSLQLHLDQRRVPRPDRQVGGRVAAIVGVQKVLVVPHVIRLHET
eukprot:6200160-Pleurochrysis_carterae.AAC.2